jgi:multiple sugar transport system substrate-binding protein
MLRKSCLLVMAVLIVAIISAGCSKEVNEKQGATETNSPSETAKKDSTSFDYNQQANIKFFMHVDFTQSLFEQLYVNPLKKKFPNVTLELYRKPVSAVDKSIDQLLASGTIPDLTYTSIYHIQYLKNANLAEDLNPLIKKNNFDLSRFRPEIIESARKYGEKGEIYAIPVYNQVSALFYNKDIFDKFGVPYPKDNMTWPEAIELAKRVARTEGGVVYRGLDAGSLDRFAYPLSLPYVNYQTKKSAIFTDDWIAITKLFKELQDIPGNKQSGGSPASIQQLFFKDQTLAMAANQVGIFAQVQDIFDSGKPMNFDVASYPSHLKAPGKSIQVDAHMFAISPKSKYQDLIFKIIEYFTSEEQQISATRIGRLSPLKGTKIEQNAYADVPAWKGKNIAALFKTTPAQLVIHDEYSNIAIKEINAAATRITSGKQDVVEALRQAQENADKGIDALK